MGSRMVTSERIRSGVRERHICGIDDLEVFGRQGTVQSHVMAWFQSIQASQRGSFCRLAH